MSAGRVDIRPGFAGAGPFDAGRVTAGPVPQPGLLAGIVRAGVSPHRADAGWLEIGVRLAGCAGSVAWRQEFGCRSSQPGWLGSGATFSRTDRPGRTNCPSLANGHCSSVTFAIASAYCNLPVSEGVGSGSSFGRLAIHFGSSVGLREGGPLHRGPRSSLVIRQLVSRGAMLPSGWALLASWVPYVGSLCRRFSSRPPGDIHSWVCSEPRSWPWSYRFCHSFRSATQSRGGLEPCFRDERSVNVFAGLPGRLPSRSWSCSWRLFRCTCSRGR